MATGFMCALLKFGAGTVVSSMLHQTPVASRRSSTLTFAVALLLIQSCPGDLVNTCLNGPTHLMVFVANALYKARKFTFALEASVAIGAQIPLTVLVTWLAVEGSSSARRVESVLHRLFHHPSPAASWYDFVHGVFLPLLRQAVPIVVLSLASRAALMAGDGGEHDATGGSANVLQGYGVSCSFWLTFFTVMCRVNGTERPTFPCCCIHVVVTVSIYTHAWKKARRLKADNMDGHEPKVNSKFKRAR